MSKEKTYKVKEIHYTIQGEGANAGLPMVFVRFTGCNIWTGREEDRERSAKNGMCALWCDTDFRGTDGKNGGTYTRRELIEKIDEIGKFSARWEQRYFTHGVVRNRLRTVKGVVAFTGGEPLLQVDKDLVADLRQENVDVCIETNGTQDITAIVGTSLYKELKGKGNLWITVSPKPPAEIHESVHIYGVDEIKVVLDKKNMDPKNYESIPADNYYVQPLDDQDPTKNRANLDQVLAYVMLFPNWRISSQNHKDWRLP
jgi:7-carboxy-7-deazaguanine synthase